MQAVQDEAQRAQADPPLNIPGGQHKLAILYIMDAVCSVGKSGSKALQEKLRTSFRKACSQKLSDIVALLVTPLNCNKVRYLDDAAARGADFPDASLGRATHSLRHIVSVAPLSRKQHGPRLIRVTEPRCIADR